MSLFGAMTTAISGLSSQSTAFSNIGENLANTQTLGYKSVGTTFDNYISVSNLSNNESGAVVARPQYNNDLQGSISQTSNALNLAISGAGLFAVSAQNGTSNSLPTFSSQPLYTRQGDFSLNANGYITNSSGNYLNAWPVGANGQVDTTSLQPLQVGESGYAPVPTTTASIAANLPASPPAGMTPATTQMPIIDPNGTQQNLELTWTPPTATAPNVWNLAISQQGSTTPLGSVNVTFATASTGTVPSGTIASLSGATGGVTVTPNSGTQAEIGFTANFGGSAPQPISLDLGAVGGTDGVTQFAGTTYNLVSLTQNGVPPGAFSSVSMQENGDVVVNYDNGSSRTIAQVPVVTFAAPDSLQMQNGQTYSPTPQSGNARANQPGGNGAGTLVTSSVEASNVDIATEFSKLIVAQQAYSANTKMVTTADQMLQQTINMKQ